MPRLLMGRRYRALAEAEGQLCSTKWLSARARKSTINLLLAPLPALAFLSPFPRERERVMLQWRRSNDACSSTKSANGKKERALCGLERRGLLRQRLSALVKRRGARCARWLAWQTPRRALSPAQRPLWTDESTSTSSFLLGLHLHLHRTSVGSRRGKKGRFICHALASKERRVSSQCST